MSTPLNRWMVNASRAREPLSVRAVRWAVRLLVLIGLLTLCAGGAWLLWCLWTMGGVE